MKILVFADGAEKAVTGELGKYWLTGETRVRKLSGSIAEVREAPEAADEEAASPPDVKPAKKKSAAKKKKRAEAKEDGELGE